MAANAIELPSTTPNGNLHSGFGGSCVLPYTFNSNQHKSIYRVGVLAHRGIEQAYKSFNSTFSDYLTATAGKHFDPPITFEMIPVSWDTLYEDAFEADFIFSNPSVFSCIESEYRANSIASVITRRVVQGETYDLTHFGGVIVTHKDNDQVNTIKDLKGKIIAAISISGLGAAQMQFRAMQQAGLNHISSPKQLIFTGNQEKIVNGVLAKEFDVGFVRTDQIERTKDSEGNLIDASQLKIIDPKPGLQIDGEPFPFPSSTQLYPQWNLAAHAFTPADVTEAVQSAMHVIAQHGRVGEAIQACDEVHNETYCDSLPYPTSFSNRTRCDTSKDVAKIAYRAMSDGSYAGWRPTLSYMDIRSMQEATGFISLQEETNIWRCVRGTEIYDAVTCPAGYDKKSKEDVENGCEDAGLVCKDGYQCLCSPCVEPLVCTGATTKIGNKCVSYLILYTAIILPMVIVSIIAVSIFVRQQRKKADSVWTVEPKELKFDDPPLVIGKGTFGVVLLAEYRGTQCAVKRVIPPVGGVGSQSSMAKAFDYAVDIQTSSTVCDDIETGSEHNCEVKSLGTSSIGSGTRHTVARVRPSGIMTIKPISGDQYSKLKSSFIKEMRYISKLRHPCITTVMGAVVSKSHEPMLVMEYMAHGSLYEILHNKTVEIEGELLLPILLDIARGMRFLHSASPPVIHGDLKSQNILVDSKFRAKISDFGLSQKKLVGAAGTPYWMSPELLRGETTNTTNSDVYSFGIILYELYSRKEPYEGEDITEVIPKICDPTINYRPPVPATCPHKIVALQKDCILPKPKDRPTAEEIDIRLNALNVSNVAPVLKLSNALGKRQTTQVLYDVFPKHIADALSAGKKIEPESHSMVSIVFSDIVGFTTISSSVSPIKVSSMLDRLYNAFDDLATEHGVFKIETVGDAYMGVTNLVTDQSIDHTKRAADFALAAIEAASKTLIDLDDPSRGSVKLRVGIHSGPVVSNVVGNLSPKYGIFGDTVNVAARMESTGGLGRVQCSKRAAKFVKEQAPHLRLFSRGEINVKGKGLMKTYWIAKGNMRREDAKVDKVVESDPCNLDVSNSSSDEDKEEV